MDKLKELLALCKHSVSIEVNAHRDVYETVEEYLRFGDDKKHIKPDVLAEMIARDTIVCVQAHPETAGGFYLIYDYDVERAIDRAINAIKGEEA